MKIIPIIVAASFCISSAYSDPAKLKEEQVIEMAKIIAKKVQKEKDFDFEQPKYTEATGLWSLSQSKIASDGLHFLDIRDKDHYFRVGFLPGSHDLTRLTKGWDKFRMSPDVKREFKRIAGEPAK